VPAHWQWRSQRTNSSVSVVPTTPPSCVAGVCSPSSGLEEVVRSAGRMLGWQDAGNLQLAGMQRFQLAGGVDWGQR
jgi:hypothetical protein